MMRYSNGEIYDGEWRNGERQGIGRMQQPDLNQYYYGNWKGDKAEGRGVMTKYHDNTGILARYEGGFTNGQLNGEGVMTDTAGNVYNGHFEDTTYTGPGSLQLVGGERFTGQWRGDQFIKGQFTNYEGETYLGHFYNFKADGQGRVNYPSGHSYEGRLRDGMRDGLGRLMHPDGITFEGTFRDDKKFGAGRLIDKEGKIAGYDYYLDDKPMGVYDDEYRPLDNLADFNHDKI